jgi:hypothetical protein
VYQTFRSDWDNVPDMRASQSDLSHVYSTHVYQEPNRGALVHSMPCVLVICTRHTWSTPCVDRISAVHGAPGPRSWVGQSSKRCPCAKARTYALSHDIVAYGEKLSCAFLLQRSRDASRGSWSTQRERAQHSSRAVGRIIIHTQT